MSQLLRWQIGAVQITRVQELEAPGMRFIVPHATIDNLAGISWLSPFLAANGDALGSVHALVVEETACLQHPDLVSDVQRAAL